MGGLKSTSLWLLFSLTAVTLAHPDSVPQSLHLNYLEDTALARRVFNKFEKRCTDDCATCFGAGYELCPSSSTDCYNPAYGVESCSSSSDSGSSSGSSSGSDSTSGSSGSSDYNYTSTDYCSTGSIDCEKCFGSGFQKCAESTDFFIYCFDPNNSTSICPDGSQSAAAPGSGSDSASDSASSGTGFATGLGSADSPSSTSTPSETTDAADTTPVGSSGAAGTGSNSDSSIGDTNDETSTTSTRSIISSSTISSPTSTATGNSNGSPIAASSGQSVLREGIFGVIVASVVCFIAAACFMV